MPPRPVCAERLWDRRSTGLRVARLGDLGATGPGASYSPKAHKAETGVDRTEKQAFVDDLHGSLKSANAIVVAQYAGLTVKDLTELRGKLRKAGAQLKVSKNRLTKRALEGTPFSGLLPMLKGPTAIVFSDDVVAPAKVAVAFAKDHEKLVIIGGAMGERTLDAAGVKTLASMPSLNELRAKLAGLVQAPATKVARVLQAPAAQLARVLGAYAKKPAA